MKWISPVLRAALLFLYFLPFLRSNSCSVSSLFNPRDKQLGWTVSFDWNLQQWTWFLTLKLPKEEEASLSNIHCRQAFSDILKWFQSTALFFGIIIKSNMYVSLPQRTEIDRVFFWKSGIHGWGLSASRIIYECGFCLFFYREGMMRDGILFQILKYRLE